MGKRKLEDDWRRSDKGVLNELGEDTTLTSSQLNELKELSDKKNPNYYLSKIPKSEKEVVASNKKIKEALYQVAIIYRDYFDDYKKATLLFTKSSEDIILTQFTFRLHTIIYT